MDPGFSLGPETFTIANTTGLGKGVNTYTSPQVCDNQGNCTTGELEVSLDLTPPVITLNAPPDGGNVLQADFEAPTCTATDALSGLDGVCTVVISAPSPVPGGAQYTATATAADVAGNQAEESSTFTVIIDANAPAVEATPDRPANTTGWWDGPVTFTFTCYDPGSGVASCPDPVTVDTEGAQQSITVAALDNVGNDGTLTVGGINIDATAPNLAFIGVQLEYSVSDLITVSCDATDALAGLEVVNCDTVPSIAAVDYNAWAGQGTDITGMFTLSATATDLAGNTTTTTATLTIVVDDESVAELVETYAGNGPGVNGLLSKLDNGDYAAFINQVNAKCCTPANGKLFSEEEAEILIELAEQLAG